MSSSALDILDPLFSQIGKSTDTIVRTTQGVAQDQGAALVQQMIASTQFQKVLDAVQARAQAAVVEEVKGNAFALMTFAVAGGALGGIALGKRGWQGVAVAAALAVWAGSHILQAQSAPKKV